MNWVAFLIGLVTGALATVVSLYVFFRAGVRELIKRGRLTGRIDGKDFK